MSDAVRIASEMRVAGSPAPGWRTGLALLGVLLAVAAPARGATEGSEASSLNGFDLRGASVPREEIVDGGPGRDGVPVLDHPEVLAANEGRWLPRIRVLGVVRGGEARAYPIPLLEWHEVINDTLGGEPILVTYCPLCGTAMVFDRRVEGVARSFGVSGLLHKSDLLMYDRESESLWSQIAARAITGPARGRSLALLRGRLVRWDVWRSEHPETTVVSPETGYKRPYGRSPYKGYRRSKKLRFPAPVDDRYHPKLPTVGLRAADGQARAYPLVEVQQAGNLVQETFAGAEVEVRYDAKRSEFSAKAPDAIDVIEGFWFAWMAFHPDSSVFVAPDVEADASASSDSERAKPPPAPGQSGKPTGR